MSPLAGSTTARGIFKTKSGLGIVQLSTQRRGCGVSVASPAGDFASTHSASVSISAGLNDGSLETFPHSDRRTMAAWILPALRGECLGERMSFFVRFERHRGDAPGAVATLTVPFQDRKHVAIESRWIRSGSVLRKRSVQPYQ